MVSRLNATRLVAATILVAGVHSAASAQQSMQSCSSFANPYTPPPCVYRQHRGDAGCERTVTEVPGTWNWLCYTENCRQAKGSCVVKGDGEKTVGWDAQEIKASASYAGTDSSGYNITPSIDGSGVGGVQEDSSHTLTGGLEFTYKQQKITVTCPDVPPCYKKGVRWRETRCDVLHTYKWQHCSDAFINPFGVANTTAQATQTVSPRIFETENVTLQCTYCPGCE